nr:sodium/iodide cotransporter-like [Rhipicephalus microplus]
MPLAVGLGVCTPDDLLMGYLLGAALATSAVDGSGVEQEAFLGGRTLPSYALAVSVVASTANAVSIVGFVGHYFAHGFHFMWPGAAIPLAAAVAATVMVPLLYRLRVASVFQYLRMRFDNKVGTTACIVFFILSQILGAVGVYSSAIAVSTMFPIPMMYSSIAIGLAGTIYTALGGLRSVVWADCVQALVMFASPFIIIGKVIYDSYYVSPPLRPIVDINVTDYVFRQESSNDDISRGLDDDIDAFDFTAGDEISSDHPGTSAVIHRTNLDFTTDENMWSGLAGAIPFSFVRTVFDQMAVQRFMAAKTLREAQRLQFKACLATKKIDQSTPSGATTGIMIIYWYRDCNPVLSGTIKSFDQNITPNEIKYN